MESILKTGERLDQLENGLKIIQNPNWFCFGTDAVMLANFAAAKPNETLLDLCTGNGIIPILLSIKTRCQKMVGLEIQTPVAEMAKRSVEFNCLQNRIKILTGDVRQGESIFGVQSFDVITCNPPYMVKNSGKTSLHESALIARHEVACTLEDVIKVSSKLLGSGGRFYMVHRTERLTDIFSLMRHYKLEPKRLQLIHPSISKAPNLLLIEGQKDRKSGLKMCPPIYLYGGENERM